MSKRTIRVTIDCNAKDCGNCNRFQRLTNFCEEFGYLGEYGERCPECIAAEVKK